MIPPLQQALSMFGTSLVTSSLLKDALRPVADDLKTLNELLLSYIPVESRTSTQVLGHIFEAGGKRIRPALYFMACKVLGYRGEHYFPIAAVTEFVHTASLLHDDVVDDATTRRGKPTANCIWGDQASVLVGDLIYSRASEMMAQTGNMEVVRTFASAIRHMSEGELLQLENVFNPDTEESTYLRILECKTAVLIAAACRSAALLACADTTTTECLTAFGRDIGMAFQLIDDALDYTGTGTMLGKPALADLAEGKITLPVILLRQRADQDDQRRLKSILGKQDIARADVAEVARMVTTYDTAGATIARANDYTTAAMRSLARLPASEDRDHLEFLANKLLYRTS